MREVSVSPGFDADFETLPDTPLEPTVDQKKALEQISEMLEGKAAYLNTGVWAKKALKEAKGFGEVVEVSKNELLETLSYVRRHISCKEMDFRIAFGLDDAAKTGITTD